MRMAMSQDGRLFRSHRNQDNTFPKPYGQMFSSNTSLGPRWSYCIVLIVQAFYQTRACSIAIFSSQIQDAGPALVARARSQGIARAEIVTIPFGLVSVVIVAVSGSSLSAGAAKFELRRFANDRSNAKSQLSTDLSHCSRGIRWTRG